MHSTLNFLKRFLLKLRSFYQAEDHYPIRVGDCYYCEEEKEYMAVINVKGKRGAFKLPVRKIVSDQKMLSRIHPLQASSLGWIAHEAGYQFAANDQQYLSKSSRL